MFHRCFCERILLRLGAVHLPQRSSDTESKRKWQWRGMYFARDLGITSSERITGSLEVRNALPVMAFATFSKDSTVQNV